MKHKALLIYTWLVKIILFALPDMPIIMRFRGWLYSLGMRHCGKNFQVAHNVILNSLEGLSAEDNVYLAMGCVLLAGGDIHLGKDVMFGPLCVVSSGNHTFSDGSYRYGKSSSSAVLIGDGSWIAANCTVLAGTKFPEQSILAAGSVATHKLPNMGKGIYGGSPAHFIK